MPYDGTKAPLRSGDAGRRHRHPNPLGSGKEEDTVIPARRQSHALSRVSEQRSAVSIGGCDLLEQGPVRFRVGTHGRVIGETLALDLPGPRDASGY